MIKNIKKFISVICCGAIISGCAKVKGPAPFSGDREAAPIKSLSVALVLPKALDLRFNKLTLREMTKNQQTFVKGMGASNPASAFQLLVNSIYDGEKMYRSLLSVFYQDFKSVEVVSSVDDPRAREADLIAVPNVVYGIEPPSVGKVVLVTVAIYLVGMFIIPLATKFDASVRTVFYSPDRSQVAIIDASIPTFVKRKPAAFPPKSAIVYESVMPMLSVNLDTALQTSPELEQYANSRSAKLLTRAPSQSGRARSKIIASDVDQPNYTFAPNPANYAVVVGVGDYQNFPDSPYAKRDANAVRAHLRALGYPSQNIILLTDSQATGTKMRSYLESWLTRNVTKKSKVLFYFSGYGAPDAATKQAYLVPWDGDANFLANTGYPLSRLYEKLNALEASEIVVALDAGFSGTGAGSVLAEGARPLVTKVDAGTEGKTGKVTIMSAGAGDDTVGPKTDQGHGLFTYYLLKALNDNKGDGTAAQLFDALKPRVSDAARSDSRNQTPQIIGSNPDNVSLH